MLGRSMKGRGGLGSLIKGKNNNSSFANKLQTTLSSLQSSSMSQVVENISQVEEERLKKEKMR